MKHQLPLILIILLIFQTHLAAQWASIGEGIDTSSRDYFSISVIDSNTIWAIPVDPRFNANYEYTRTTDGGQTWHEGALPSTMGNYYPGNIFALSDSIAWIIMIENSIQDRIKIFKTSDAATSWTEQTGLFNTGGHAFGVLHFFNKNDGLGFGSPGTSNQVVDSLQIFITSDGGDNWARIAPSTLPAPLSGEGVWLYSGNSSYDVQGDNLWFVTRANRVFKTTDKGATWNAYDAGISGTNNLPGLSSIAFQDADNGIVTAFESKRAAITFDGGLNWFEIPMPPAPSFGQIEHIPGTEDTYLLIDGFETSRAVLLTEDGGNSWTTMVLPPTVYCMQFLSPTVGFAGGSINPINPNSNVGIFKWTGDLSDSVGTAIQQFDDASNLIQLSPNPTSTNVILKIDRKFTPENLSIIIYSLDGKKVSTSTHSFSPKITIDIHKLSAGMYLLEVRGKDKFAIKKFVISR